jgi:site-specific recombinase XerD
VNTAERAKSYLENARSRNTIRGYRSSFKQFRLWCETARLSAMPAAPETIALYLAAQAGRIKAGTLAHHLAAIAKAHKSAGHPSPIRDNQLICETFKGIKRVHGSAQTQKAPVLTAHLKSMLDLLPNSLGGLRDRALLLVGFAGAFRRSEMVAFNVCDLEFPTEGLLLNIRKSKTDQEGEGRKVAIPFGQHPETCAVGALRAWLVAAAIVDGPIFHQVDRHKRVIPGALSGQSVALVVKKHIGRAGMDAKLFSGHSLRAGFVTSAAMADVPERRIMRTTGHKSCEMVQKYIRRADCFRDNAALALGL